MGSNKALNVFKQIPQVYKSYLQANQTNQDGSVNKNDSRSLENMKKAIEAIKLVNAKRQKDGGIDGRKLSVLKISDFDMAVAQANANFSTNIIDHAKVYNPPYENLYWGYYENADEAIEGWWDEEKEIFDNLRAKGYKSRTQMMNDGYTVGHYTNLVDDLMWGDYNFGDSQSAGYAIAKGGVYPYVHSLVLNPDKVDTTYSIDQYEKRLNDYMNDLKAKIDGKLIVNKEDQAKIDALNKEIEVIQNELKAKNDQISKLENKIASLSGNFADESGLELEKNTLDLQKISLNEIIKKEEGLKEEIKSLNNKLSQIPAKIQKLEDEKTQLENKLKAKESEKAKAEALENENDIAKLNDEKSNLEEQKSKIQVEISNLSSNAGKYQKDLDKKEAKLKDVQGQIEKSNKELKDLNNEKTSLDKSIKDGKDSLLEKENIRNKAQIKLDESQESLEDARAKLKLVSENNKDYRESLENLNKAKAEFESAKNSYEKYQKDRDLLGKEVKNLEKEILAYKDENEKAQNINISDEESFKDYDNILNLYNSYNEILGQIKDLEEKIPAYKKDLDIKLRNLNKEQENLEDKARAYKESLEELASISKEKDPKDENTNSKLRENEAKKENQASKTYKKDDKTNKGQRKSVKLSKKVKNNKIKDQYVRNNPKTGLGSSMPLAMTAILSLLGLGKTKKKKED